ncbi:uncharacterized protein LOC144434424 [Glandiceps talaboti]
MEVYLLCSVLLFLLPIETAGDCKQINSCTCQLDDGTEINLKPIAKNDGTARFLDVKGQESANSYYYSYNPCFDFTESGDCSKVGVCQKNQDASPALYYDLGDQTSATFKQSGNDIILEYKGSGTADPTLRTSQVRLLCANAGSTDTLIAYGETYIGSVIYTFDLVSTHCCPTTNSGGSGGLSVGSILCIIALVLVIVYIIVGVLVMKFVKHEEGVELIPNKGFWVSLPGLIKDGFLFAISPCRKGSSAYNEI